jgi:hypothetical protein
MFMQFMKCERQGSMLCSFYIIEGTVKSALLPSALSWNHLYLYKYDPLRVIKTYSMPV